MKIYAVFSLLAPTTAFAGGSDLFGARPSTPVSVAPATESQKIVSPGLGLPDQQIQQVNFPKPFVASLIAVANRGGSGHRSFYVSVTLAGGGSFDFQTKEGLADVLLPLAQPVTVKGVWVRCDSFSGAVCQYTISLVGAQPDTKIAGD